MNFKRLLKGTVLGLLIGIILGSIFSIFSLTDGDNYTVRDNIFKYLYAIFITITLPIFLFGAVLGFINSLRKSKKEISRLFLILKLIIAFIITIFLLMNIVDILPEIKEKQCLYIIDKVSDPCEELYALMLDERDHKINNSEFNRKVSELEECLCRASTRGPLFRGDKLYEIEFDKKELPDECVYHKECEEVENNYFPKEGEQYKENDIRNINIEVRSPGIIRSGNQALLILTVKNVNKRTDIFIKNIKFLDSNKRVIETFEINKTFKPIGKEINRINKIYSRMNKSPLFYIYYMITSYYDKNLEKDINKIDSNSFRQSFRTDLRQFTDLWVVGKNVVIFVEIEVSYNNKDYFVEEQHSVLISEPLPGPPHD